MKRVRPVVSAPRAPYNSDALEANAWFLLTRAFVLGCDTDKPWEEFRGIFGQAGLLKLKLTLKEILLGGIRDKYWIVSHRWICPEHPDWKEDEPQYQSAKLKKLQELLRENPHIEGVWIDYACLPQGEKNAEEKEYFGQSLQSVNYLYLCGTVLIFVDGDYMLRFWTQYEAFCSFHKATAKGIAQKSLKEISESVKIVEMGTAAETQGATAQALINKWHTKTVDEAVPILSHPDTKVTNNSDKPQQVEKLKQLNEALKRLFAQIEQDKRDAEAAQAQQARDQARQQLESEAQARTKAEAEQNARLVADFEDRVASLEASIEEKTAAKEAAKQSDEFDLAKSLQKELADLEEAKSRLVAAETGRLANRGKSDHLRAAQSSTASSPVAADIAGLETELELLQERLAQARALPAVEADIKLLRSLQAEIVEKQQARERKLEEQRRHEAKVRAEHETEKKRRREEEAAQKAEEQRRQEQQARDREQLAADQAAMEQERKSIVEQMEAALAAGDVDRLETLQESHKGLPKTVEEWRARKAAEEEAARRAEEKRAAEARAEEQRRQAAAEKARREEAKRKAAEEEAAARRKAAEEKAAAKAVARQTMDRREGEYGLPAR